MMDEIGNDLLTEKGAALLYARAWNRLDPTELIGHLAENVRYESQNVWTPLQSAGVVADYLIGKMDTIRKNPENRVYAELAEAVFISIRPCVLVAQSDPDNLLAVVLFGVSGNKITSIDICSGVPHPRSAKRSGIYPE